jgi:hypothetical protein
MRALLSDASHETNWLCTAIKGLKCWHHSEGNQYRTLFYAGWWFQSLWKIGMSSQFFTLFHLIPNIWKVIRNFPNHQPAMWFSLVCLEAEAWVDTQKSGFEKSAAKWCGSQQNDWCHEPWFNRFCTLGSNHETSSKTMEVLFLGST